MKPILILLFGMLQSGIFMGQNTMACDWISPVSAEDYSLGERFNLKSNPYFIVLDTSGSFFEFVDPRSGRSMGKKNRIEHCPIKNKQNPFISGFYSYFENEGTHYSVQNEISFIGKEDLGRGNRECFDSSTTVLPKDIIPIEGQYKLNGIKKSPNGEIFIFYSAVHPDLQLGKDGLIFKLQTNELVLVGQLELESLDFHESLVSLFYPISDGFLIVKNFVLYSDSGLYSSKILIRKLDLSGNLQWETTLSSEQKESISSLGLSRFEVNDQGDIYFMFTTVEKLNLNGEQIFSNEEVNNSTNNTSFIVLNSEGNLKKKSVIRNKCLSSGSLFSFDFKVLNGKIYLLFSNTEDSQNEESHCDHKQAGLVLDILDLDFMNISSLEIISSPVSTLKIISIKDGEILIRGKITDEDGSIKIGDIQRNLVPQTSGHFLSKLSIKSQASEKEYSYIKSDNFNSLRNLIKQKLTKHQDSTLTQEIDVLTESLSKIKIGNDSLPVDLSEVLIPYEVILDTVFYSLVTKKLAERLAVDSATNIRIDSLVQKNLIFLSKFDSTIFENPHDDNYHSRVSEKIKTIIRFLRLYPFELLDDQVYLRNLEMLLATSQNIFGHIWNIRSNLDVSLYYHFERFIAQFEHFYPDDFKDGAFGYLTTDLLYNTTCSLDDFFPSHYKLSSELIPKGIKKTLVYYEAINPTEQKNKTLDNFRITYTFAGCYEYFNLCTEEQRIKVIDFAELTSPTSEILFGGNYIMWLSNKDDREIKAIDKMQLREKVEKYGYKLYSSTSQKNRKKHILLRPRGWSAIFHYFLVYEYHEDKLKEIYYTNKEKFNGMKMIDTFEKFKSVVDENIKKHSYEPYYFFPDQIYLNKDK